MTKKIYLFRRFYQINIYFWIKEEFSLTNAPTLPAAKLAGDDVTIKRSNKNIIYTDISIA